MKFALSAENRQFAESLDQLLAESDTPSVVRAWGRGDHGPGRRLWSQLAEVGATSLLVPDKHGGLDAEPIDLVVACERLGHHAAPGPLVESLAAIPVLLSGIGGDAAERHLPALCSGELLGTLVAPPQVPYALDADVAGLVLRVDGEQVREAEVSGAEPRHSVDIARRLFTVGEGGPLLATDPAVVARAFDVAALACAAQLLGAGQWLLETATAHAKQRKQYGREIGQFQAIKHLLADVATELELARPLVHGAAVALADPSAGEPARDVSAAKVATADAAYLAARTCLQVHGAIGYTDEHDLGLWLTKVRALVAAWGTSAHHRQRVASSLEAHA